MELIKGDCTALRKETERIVDFNLDVRKVLYKMARSLSVFNGYALAANQVSYSLNMFVMDLGLFGKKKQRQNIIFVINMEIKSYFGKTESFKETCLSFPGKYVDIDRPTHIEIEYYDAYGKMKTLSASGLLARVIQHEHDHLRGKLIIDYGQLKDLKK